MSEDRREEREKKSREDREKAQRKADRAEQRDAGCCLSLSSFWLPCRLSALKKKKKKSPTEKFPQGQSGSADVPETTPGIIRNITTSVCRLAEEVTALPSSFYWQSVQTSLLLPMHQGCIQGQCLLRGSSALGMPPAHPGTVPCPLSSTTSLQSAIHAWEKGLIRPWLFSL